MKKVPYRKRIMEEKKSLNEKEVEVKNRAIAAKKESPVTEVNNRMDERKKSSIEKEKDHEMKTK